MQTTPLCSIMWYKHSRLQSWISQENTVERDTVRKKKTTSFSQHVYIHQPWLTFGGMGHMITVLHRRDTTFFLAVQDSSIGDLVTQSVHPSVRDF